MIENRNSVSTNVDPLQSGSAVVPWIGCELSTEPVAVRGKRILLAEDEEPLRACLRMLLEVEGHHVTEARNGAEALKLFTAGEFDLVITDFEMPVMEGDRLAAGIKLLAPSLPILMITGSVRVPGGENAVDALLDKPFTAADLQGAIEKLLRTRPEPAQADVVPWR